MLLLIFFNLKKEYLKLSWNGYLEVAVVFGYEFFLEKKLQFCQWKLLLFHLKYSSNLFFKFSKYGVEIIDQIVEQALVK